MAGRAVYNILRVSIDTVNWTPISPTRDCNSIVIVNTSASRVMTRTDPADSATEDYIDPQFSEALTGETSLHGRFAADRPVLYAKATAGTGPLVVKSLL